MKRATELNPNDATAHLWYGLMLTSFGRTDDAVKELRRGIEIDPFSKTLQMNLARAYVYGRQFDRAIEEARKALGLPLAFNRRVTAGLRPTLLRGRLSPVPSQRVAEEEGFEPPVPFQVQRFSRPPP